MVYIILISGLALIYAALRKGKGKDTTPIFNNVIKEKADNYDIESLKVQVTELTERVDELEKALLLLSPEFIESDSQNFDITSTVNIQKEPEKSDIKIEEPKEKPDGSNQINKQIFSLYDSGRSIEDIASFLHIGKGEISLRLGLRKQRI